MDLEQIFAPAESFVARHVGPRERDLQGMVEVLGFDDLASVVDAAVPAGLRMDRELDLPAPLTERRLLTELRGIAGRNELFRSYLGMGYHGCLLPPVIQRNVLENPGWYTQYTPYQAEIAQGRLEALLNFQTLVSDLTGLPMANASLLDEGTAAAEAMTLCHALGRQRKNRFLASGRCHPQTLAVLATRAEPLGIELEVVDDLDRVEITAEHCGVLLQSPDTCGRIQEYSGLAGRVREAGALLVVATDLLALSLMKPPGELGAHLVVGSSQRFGVPLGLGGPHAAFMACEDDFKRQLPGRLVGVSKDDRGRPALRLALQTREQHIRREKATSNICTAQVLLAVIASMYAVYHGPGGLRRIARRVHRITGLLAAALRRLGHDPGDAVFFDTLRVEVAGGGGRAVIEEARRRGINLRAHEDGAVGVALDETVHLEDVTDLLAAFNGGHTPDLSLEELAASVDEELPEPFARTSDFLTQEVFNRYHSEHEMLRYLHRLQDGDLSLTHSMIPLGSCTMKLNGTAEMLPVSWPELADLHPFAPADQWEGYRELFRQLEAWLAEITGFDAVSLMPNAGSQGEYTGLLTIRAYHRHRGDEGRDVCLIPTSAHGTNPASAVMAGLRVVAVACDEQGNIDLGDLEAKAAEHEARLAALMITYPSTHGVFEEKVREVCRIVHDHGGQVYLDGANMNAMVGLCQPASFGADVCHLNLHKTFCIPHGGGGPGVGPICARRHLAAFLPTHPLAEVGGSEGIGPVAAAPWGSPLILPISWAYIALMGPSGLRRASEVAILNANYMAKRLGEHYPILYTGAHGLVAHEFILDLRSFRQSAGVTVDDVAKRLMDFGFHAPTMSWPVAGTMMVEPTESESKEELDRFCEAMIAIREEIRAIEQGRLDPEDNPLRRAPHTAEALAASWERSYSREQAAYPLPWVREKKFWPAVGRIDNVYGDRHLVCTCDSVEELAAAGVAE